MPQIYKEDAGVEIMDLPVVYPPAKNESLVFVFNNNFFQPRSGVVDIAIDIHVEDPIVDADMKGLKQQVDAVEGGMSRHGSALDADEGFVGISVTQTVIANAGRGGFKQRKIFRGVAGLNHQDGG